MVNIWSSSFEKAPSLGQTQTGLRSRVYFFTNTGCCSFGSDAGRVVLSQKPVLSFKMVRFLLHVVSNVWGLLTASQLQFGAGAKSHWCNRRMASPGTITQNIELNSICSAQAYSMKPGISY